MLNFTVTDTDNTTNARAGRVETPHGAFSTPAFMPVGTRGSVKGLLPESISGTGSEIILANTYHLMLRPGVDVVESAGGLHEFISWSGPILTDSGGFQVFSLAELRQIDDEGVTFNSHIDGQKIRLDPAGVIKTENRLGADIIMAFDECPAWPVDFAQAEQAVNRTVRWARVCRDVHKRSDQGLFGIVQGSLFPDLREKCLKELVKLDFAGYALGGLSVGEGPGERKEIVDEFAPMLPDNKPRYLMGVGRPVDILQSVSAGVDMFDCVIPTRNGRNAQAFTSKGVIKLRNEKFKFDYSPVDENCECYCCRNFTKSYIRHLFLVSEMLGPILLSIHNISYFQNLMKEIRDGICQNRLTDVITKYMEIEND